MPIIDVPIKEFPRHVLEPLVRSRVKGLIQSFNLESVIGDNVYIKYGFSTNTKSRDNNKNINIRTNRVDVEVNLNMDPTNLKWDMTSFKFTAGYGFRIDQLTMDRATFMDPEVGVSLHLHEMPCTVSMNVNITLLSRTLAFTLLAANYEMYGAEANTWFHESFMYDLPVNKMILNKLYAIYNMRRFDKNKLTFQNYLNVGSRNAIAPTINRAADSKEMVLRMFKMRLLEDVNIAADKPQENADNNGTFSYTVPFTHDIQFSRPAFFSLVYPITVMNRLIPAQHIVPLNENTSDVRNSDFVSMQIEKATYDYWSSVYQKYDQCFMSPFYDDWKEPIQLDIKNYSQRPFWSIALTLDENQTENALPITEVALRGNIVDKFHLNPIVEDIILTQGCESYEPDCLFNVSIFKNDRPYYPFELDWDMDDATIKLRETDLSGQYHIVISEMMNLKFLNPKWDFLVDRYKDFFDNRNGNNVKDIINNTDRGNTDGYIISARVLYGDIIPVK